MNHENIPVHFTQQVLDALQLNPCQQAQTLLDEHAHKLLPSLHAELTQQHLDNCADCSALHAAIMMLNARLPALQSLRVPQGFTASVMQRTVLQEVTRRHEQKPRRLVAWLMRPRFALESAYAMTVIVMLFSGLTGVNAFDTFDPALWERLGPAAREARPRFPEATMTFEHLSTQLTEQAEQQTEKMTTTYDDTARAIESWTKEKYTAFRERYAALMR